MSSSRRRNCARGILVALVLGVIGGGCDLTAPTELKKHGDALVANASRTGGGSSISASAVSWNEIDVSWTATSNATGYQLFRSTSGAAGPYAQIAQMSASITTYANTGLSGSTEYCYEIRSFRQVGRNINYSAYSSPACATTPPAPVPAAPTEINAVPQVYQIQVTWKDNSSNETGFHIEQAPTPTGGWTLIINANADATSAYVYATAEQQTCFRVMAFSSAGSSAPSAPDCTALPASPTGLSANAADGQAITLSWTDNSGVEDGYKVSRYQPGLSWEDVATLPANAVTYRDVAVSADVVYSYRVQAIKDGGYSEFSNEVTAVIPTSAPDAPSNAEAFYNFDAQFNTFTFYVIWNDNSYNEQGFRVEYTDGNGGWYTFGETLANETSFSYRYPAFLDPGLTCVRVIAFNTLGDSSPSNETCADTNGFPGFQSGGNVITNRPPPTNPRHGKPSSPRGARVHGKSSRR